jgi:short-subunit dehydrogenase
MNRNKYALITGATSGIGYELARLFAKDGYNLVIVSRSGKRALNAAEEFKQVGAPSVTMIVKDLAEPTSAEEIYALTKEKGIEIDVLVNDAGMGVYGYFHKTDLSRELAIIQLNITSLVQLTKFYLRDMLERNEGRILQVASIAAYQPTPLLSVYAATKAFVLSFTDALIDELKGTNVKMTALIPGATDTDFFRKAGAEHTRAAHEAGAPEEVARTGYESLMRNEHHAIAPGVRSQVIMSSILPNETITARAHKAMEEVE